MDIQNRTIGDLFTRVTQQQSGSTTQDVRSDVLRFAETIFSDQLLRRYTTVVDLNRADERNVEELARVSILIAPIFLRVWNEVSEHFVNQNSERRAA